MTKFFFKNIESELCELIRSATNKIYIAVTWFTNDNIFQELLKKLETEGFSAHLIVLNDRINNKTAGLDFQSFVDKGGNFYYSSLENMVHHKFCIIDDELVVTGSYNWTYYAEHRNWENIAAISDNDLVAGYIDEFNSIIEKHEPIKKIASAQNKTISTYGAGFLKEDYVFQAESEVKKGNELKAARIYNEVLRIDSKQPTIVEARRNIVSKFNTSEFEISPFEIGILYKNGYSMAIPAFIALPYTAVKGGQTVEDNQKNIQITIQKFDISATTILTLNLNNIKPDPSGTEKIEHVITLDRTGKLTVTCKEVGGNMRVVSKVLDIRSLV